jgi:colanic acid biosynthesis glycosyl transferase WcaI
MKRALIFTMYYWPEPTGIAPMATNLAEELGELGWKVTVVTGFPMMPDWEVYKGYRRKVYMREVKEKTEIYRSWVYVPTKPKQGTMKTWKRIAFDTTLILGAIPTLLSHKADVIVAIGPPLQTGFFSLFLKRLWRCPVLYWLQDIVPDAALNVGMMQSGTALKMARRMEQAVYKGVDQIGFISQGFQANLLAKGVPTWKQVFLPNWADLSIFDQTPADAGMRRSLGIGEDEFVVMHAGSMGAKQALENVLHAMKGIDSVEKIRLVFLGGGNRADAIKSETERLDLTRCVTFLPAARGADYVNKLRMADLLLINQAGEVVDALIPSKLLTYLPSERATVAAVNAGSETARFIEQAGCGLIVEPDNPGALAAGILQLKQEPGRRTQMGTTGAAFIRAHFEKSVLLERFTTVLARMAAEAPT